MERGLRNNVCCCFLQRVGDRPGHQPLKGPVTKLGAVAQKMTMVLEELHYRHMAKRWHSEEAGIWGPEERHSENGSWAGQTVGHPMLGLQRRHYQRS